MDWLKGRVVYIRKTKKCLLLTVMDWLKGRVVYIRSKKTKPTTPSWIG